MAQGTGIQSTWGSPVATVKTSAQGPEYELGSLRLEGAKWYKYVQYKATAIACAAGKVAGYYSVDGHKLNQVTLDTSDQIAAGTLLAAGVTQAVIPTDGYGWVQFKGFATVVDAFIAGADGQPLSLVGATADTGDLDLAADNLDNICAWAGDVTDKEIILDCVW